MSRRILFVDDEPNILDGLRRSLRACRSEWHMLFVGSGAEALRVLDSEPVDVVVTDMRMPGMDGDELLAAIRRDHPQVVRMVLTGQCTQESMLRLVPLAHRVFTKPCPPEDLRAAITHACKPHALSREQPLATLVARLTSLPSQPTLHGQILAELQRSEGSLDAVGHLIAQDVALTAKLMQVVNSALLGLRQPTTDACKAVSILGTEGTRALVLMTGVCTRYDPAALLPFSIDELWGHSRAVAALAGKIAESEGLMAKVSECRLAGLFHDIGQLVLATQEPNAYKEVLRLVGGGMLVTEAERRVFSATHCEVGAYLLGLWGLPTALVDAVAWHHAPRECRVAEIEPVTATHLAEALLAPGEGGGIDELYLESLDIRDRLPGWQRLAGQLAAGATP